VWIYAHHILCTCTVKLHDRMSCVLLHKELISTAFGAYYVSQVCVFQGHVFTNHNPHLPTLLYFHKTNRRARRILPGLIAGGIHHHATSRTWQKWLTFSSIKQSIEMLTLDFLYENKRSVRYMYSAIKIALRSDTDMTPHPEEIFGTQIRATHPQNCSTNRVICISILSRLLSP
jgi:hypothetical protein